MIVDDDKNISQILYTALNAKGYHTSVAKNGEDALKKFEQEKPNLILLDVLLPRINGWEVCKKIREISDGEETKIIIMTALYKSMKHRSDSIYKYGADEFVEKPFQLSELMEIIREMIGEGELPEVNPDVVIDPDEEASRNRVIASDDTTIGTIKKSKKPSAAPKKEKDLQFEGLLAEFPLPQLIHSFYTIKETGILFLKREGVEKEIAIKDGYPVSIKSTIDDEKLGNFLVKLGKITQEECLDSLKLMKTNKRLQGVTLVEMGLITPQELSEFLRLQAREKLYEAFAWEDGEYKFGIDASVTGDISTFDMSPATVIFEGIKKKFSLDRLRKELDQFHMKYVVQGKNLFYRFQDLQLSKEEKKIKEFIEGDRMVGEVLSLSEMDLIKTYQLLYTLSITEMIEFRDTPGADEEEEEFIPDSLESPSTSPASQQALDEADMPIDINDEESALRMKIVKTYQKMEAMNYFQILGLTDAASDGDIKAAYHKLAKDYHPDKFFGKVAGDIKAKVEEIFRKVSDAYNILSDEERRKEYVSSLGSDKKKEKAGKMTEELKVIFQAEKHFQRGLELLNMRNFPKSVEELEKACKLRNNEADYMAYLGWAMYNLPIREHDGSKRDKELADEEWEDKKFQGRELINRAVKLNPRSDKAYVFLGSIYKQLRQRDFAYRQFEKALICNPNNVDALRELRLMKMRSAKGKKKKKNFFTKLLDMLHQPIGGKF
jgi:CheY-like chemotaxis protein/curved DNA-binding protein CbpA